MDKSLNRRYNTNIDKIIAARNKPRLEKEISPTNIELHCPTLTTATDKLTYCPDELTDLDDTDDQEYKFKTQI